MTKMDHPSTSQSLRVNDPDFSDTVRGLLNFEDEWDESDSDSPADDSDADPDFVLPNESAEEIDPIPGTSSDENEDDVDMLEDQGQVGLDIVNSLGENIPIPPFFLERQPKQQYGPPNAWKSEPPARNVRTPARNIINRGLPGIVGPALALGNAPSKQEVWSLFFDNEIITKIVTNTNIKLLSVRQSLAPETNKSSYRPTNDVEINALIGLLLVESVLKCNGEKMSSLFCKGEYSRPIFRAVMSLKRYEVLIMCLRFDESETREARKRNNKAAAISEIFEKIISNSQTIYRPSSYVTVDEMLVPFRGRCGFRMYMPKKPKKYGIKVMCLADAKTSYLLDAYIYTGRESDGVGLTEDEKKLSIPTQSLIRLCKSVQGSNRNVTADNWFSSTEGVAQLRKRKLTYVGTMKKDKKAIPEEFLPNKRRPVYSTLYGFREDMALMSFVPKKNRAVCLISSMHNTIETNQEKKKPEIISFYNSTKAGVDLLDMKCAIFSSNRKTRRWPLAIFYRLVSIASVNAFVVYMCYRGNTLMNRFDFIKSLAHDLIVPHLRTRLDQVANLPRGLKMDIQSILGNNVPADLDEAVPDDRLQKRKSCQKCPPCSDRKTSHKCIKCSYAICGQCQRRVCIDCAKDCVANI